MTQPRYSTDEIVQRGKALYDRELRSKVEAGNKGKVLVIDIESGDYEIDAEHLPAAQRLRARRPDASLFAMRIGYPSLGRLGARFFRGQQ